MFWLDYVRLLVDDLDSRSSLLDKLVCRFQCSVMFILSHAPLQEYLWFPKKKENIFGGWNDSA